jgi:hypothetical protein
VCRYETTNHLWLILEYCVGGDLMSLLRQDVRLPESSIHDFGRDMVVALQVRTAGRQAGRQQVSTPAAVPSLRLASLRLSTGGRQSADVDGKGVCDSSQQACTEGRHSDPVMCQLAQLGSNARRQWWQAPSTAAGQAAANEAVRVCSDTDACRAHTGASRLWQGRCGTLIQLLCAVLPVLCAAAVPARPLHHLL